jgi:hypothetical protein
MTNVEGINPYEYQKQAVKVLTGIGLAAASELGHLAKETVKTVAKESIR